jgi:hypothetical protein
MRAWGSVSNLVPDFPARPVTSRGTFCKVTAAGVRRQIRSHPRHGAALSARSVANDSGRGQPHSKTLPREPKRYGIRQVLECGCPLPLSTTVGSVVLILAKRSIRASLRRLLHSQNTLRGQNGAPSHWPAAISGCARVLYRLLNAQVLIHLRQLVPDHH